MARTPGTGPKVAGPSRTPGGGSAHGRRGRLGAEAEGPWGWMGCQHLLGQCPEAKLSGEGELNPPGHCADDSNLRPPWLGPESLQGGREERPFGAIQGPRFIDLFPPFGAVSEMDLLKRHFCYSPMTNGCEKRGQELSLGAEGSNHKTTKFPGQALASENLLPGVGGITAGEPSPGEAQPKEPTRGSA